jgi:hypothetical protein
MTEHSGHSRYAKPRRRRSCLRRVAVVLLATIAVAISLLALLAWRVSRAPVRFDFLEPHLNQALAGDGSQPSVEIEDPVLIWGGRRRPLDMRAGPVRVRDPQGRIMLAVTDASVGLALAPLFHGRIAPTRIEISANPMTALPPGILRDLFRLPSGSGGSHSDEGDSQ